MVDLYNYYCFTNLMFFFSWGFHGSIGDTMGIYWVVHNAKFLDSTKAAASIMWEPLAALKNYHHDWGWYP